MKKTLFLFAVSTISFACQQKSPQQVTKEQLEKTMARFLEKNQAEKDTKIEFSVKDVSWFEESNYYICEYTITMKLPNGKDTTGIMKEKVSKDPMAIQR